MEEMGRGRITRAVLAALASAVACLTAVAVGAAAVPGSGDGEAPELTGRALIGVRTPELPAGESAAASERRRERLTRSNELLDAVAARSGIEEAARSGAAGLIATELEGESIAELRRRLAGDPLVESVRPEYRFEFTHTPVDPIFQSSDIHAPGGDWAQWHLMKQSFPKAWDLGRGIGAEVAVIDSGADAGHPDLGGRVAGRLNCAGLFCFGGDVTDTIGHGTHVSGLACADSDSGYGLASAGFDCSLFVVKTDLSLASVINSIYAAADRGSDVINMSFGGGDADPDLRAALDYALARGAVLVAAADNSPAPNPGFNYPAEHLQPEGSGPNINAGKGLVVTSASHSGLRSAFAQGTAGVSIAAMGSASDAMSGGQQGILSSWPGNPVSIDGLGVRTSFGGDERFAYLVGTSMAAPQVSGLAALMRAARPALGPLTLGRLVKLSASSCGPYGTGGLGWGLINADRALGAAVGKDVDPPSSNVERAKPRKRQARRKRRARRASVAAPAVRTAKRKRGKKRRKRGNVVLHLKSADGPNCSNELPVSGVEAVHVFASANGGRWREIGRTRNDKLRFTAKRGRRYEFHSIAVDQAGNIEGPPGEADAKVRLKKKKKKKKRGRR